MSHDDEGELQHPSQ